MKTQEYQKMYRSQNTHWWYITRRKFIQTFLECIPKKKRMKILDVGCGTGANTKMLRVFGQVTGIDASLHAKMFYKKNKQASFVLGNVEQLPFHKNQFDIVVLSDVLYHANIHSPAHAMDEIVRVLKPGGYCVLTDCMHPFLFGIHDVQNQARERFTKSKLTQLIQRSGLTCIRSSYVFMMTFPVFFVVRLVDKICHRSSSSVEENIGKRTNEFFLRLGWVENQLLKYQNLPFGSSAIFLSKKM